MSKTTTNYGLTKPERSDNYNVDVMANNMDIIDAKLRNPTTASITNSGNLTNSGTITSTGLITANGGVKGICYGKLYVTAKTTTTKKNGDITYATMAKQTITQTNPSGGTTTSNTITVGNYSKISLSYPYQLCPGVFIPSSSYFTDSVPSSKTRTLTVTLKVTSGNSYNSHAYLYVNNNEVKDVYTTSGTKRATYSVSPGQSVYVKVYTPENHACTVTVDIPAEYYYISVV